GLVDDYVIWMWFLIATTFGVGLLPDGRPRTVALGASAGLAAVHMGVLAAAPEPYQNGMLLVVAAGLLVLLVACMETITGRPDGWRWKGAGAAGGLLTLVLIVVDQWFARDLRDDPFEEVPWLVVFGGAVLLLAFFLVRVVRQGRSGAARPPLVLGAAATLLVVADVCGVYLGGGSDFPQIPVYAPALLVLLLMAAQSLDDRPELLAAVQLTVVAGLVHNLAHVETGPAFLAVLFVAAVCAGAAVYLPAGVPRSR
ncbi:MAG TPA: hypothetical protein VFV66_37070, partial [Nonomuraea sp.]|nr:hypothetical protein [Nonomuraea sp.]